MDAGTVPTLVVDGVVGGGGHEVDQHVVHDDLLEFLVQLRALLVVDLGGRLVHDRIDRIAVLLGIGERNALHDVGGGTCGARR